MSAQATHQPQHVTADAEEYLQLCGKIERERGFRCSSYKEKCIRRRIASRMRMRSVPSLAEYSRLIDSDPAEFDRLIQALTITVSRFFRDLQVYQWMATKLLPQLAALQSEIRIWSAGCAAGEEPFSVAMIVHEFARMHEDPEFARRVRVVGTDLDREALATAARGEYGTDALAYTPVEYIQRYFAPAGAGYSVVPQVRNIVTFERADILDFACDRSPQHLILCRNVIIYFQREAQEQLFRTFQRLLRPGGFLVLGKVETLFGPARELFVPVSARERIFRKPGS